MNKDLTEQIDNLTPKGVALLVPFFKEVVTEETNNYTAVDGYQCAVLSMNLTIYLKVKLTMEDKSTELNPSDLNFVKSFEVILQDQEEIITKSFGKFSEFLSKYASKEEQHIQEVIFVDPKKYKELV